MDHEIQYGIAGFVIGIMTSLLPGLLEMRVTRHFQLDTALPFIIGITVISCAITGVVVGIKMVK